MRTSLTTIGRLASTTARMVGAAAVGSGLAAGIDSQTCVIAGRSMQPTLNDGCTSGEMRDRVFLDRLSPSLGWIGRGDVVVLRSPDDDALITKRIVGLAGDRVRRRNSVSQFVVPRGHVWIEGDNDEVSMDSTHFGAVATEAVEAKVACKLWPLSEVGVVRSRVHDSSAARVSREVEAEAHEPAAAWRGPKLSVSATMRSFVSQTDGRVL